MRNDNEPSLSNESEQRAHARIKELFEQACPGARVLTNVIIPTNADISVSPATAEYDVIVVCRYGVIHFEVKGWSGKELFSEVDSRGRGRWFLRFHGTDKIEERRNALKQCVGKTRILRQELKVWTQHYVVFTSPDLEIAPNMSPYLVRMSELGIVPRLVRAKHKEMCGANLDQRTIDAIADSLLEIGAEITPEMHKANVEAYVRYGPPKHDKDEVTVSSCLSNGEMERKSASTFMPSDRQDMNSAASFLLSLPMKPTPYEDFLSNYTFYRGMQSVWFMSPRRLMPMATSIP